ncbi:MAG: RNA-directed DNA polymerase [Proteobacteria bacterium]|nr:RNA-directed DNA polymerase [Pseudomonadota bacterium]
MHWPNSSRHRLIARNIAVTLLAGAWTERAMADRLETLLGSTTRSTQRGLIGAIFDKSGGPYPPSLAELTASILEAPQFPAAARLALEYTTRLDIATRQPRFAPIARFADLEIPRLTTPGDVAAWAGLSIPELEWFADERRQHGRTAIPIFQHYTYAFRKKSSGPPRLIEAPKPRLKTIQRKILRDILDHIPVHPAAHGFVEGRSPRTGAAQHVGAPVVIAVDLENFFLSVPVGRIHALFRSVGYPDEAARALTRLCTTMTPRSVIDRVPNPARHTRAALAPYLDPHLPQGAPTSPALANLVAWRLDVRLAGLANSFGAKLTRYADDIVFSGDLTAPGKTQSLIAAIAEIVEDEGFGLNDKKTRIMTASQRQSVTGIVVNSRLNARRDSYDSLKAILHNCRLNGFEAENREGHADFRAHLEGRIGWIESLNPTRGRRLRDIFSRIP